MIKYQTKPVMTALSVVETAAIDDTACMRRSHERIDIQLESDVIAGSPMDAEGAFAARRPSAAMDAHCTAIDLKNAASMDLFEKKEGLCAL